MEQTQDPVCQDALHHCSINYYPSLVTSLLWIILASLVLQVRKRKGELLLLSVWVSLIKSLSTWQIGIIKLHFLLDVYSLGEFHHIPMLLNCKDLKRASFRGTYRVSGYEELNNPLGHEGLNAKSFSLLLCPRVLLNAIRQQNPPWLSTSYNTF